MDGAGMPHPPTQVVRCAADLRRERRFPLFVKGEYGTASSSIWRVTGPAEASTLADDLVRRGVLADDRPVVVQEAARGALERAQAIFDAGRLVAIHGYRQVREGPGGGDVAKTSVCRPAVFAHLERLGSSPGWHGALSADYFFDETAGTCSFIDVNPRLVEPMNAYLAGVNLADLLVRISVGEHPPRRPASRAGVRTHLLLMAVLDAASRGSRTAVLAEVAHALARRGVFEGSREELLPLRVDPLGAAPFAVVLARILASPGSARGLASRAVTSYALTPAAVQAIVAADFPRGLPPA